MPDPISKIVNEAGGKSGDQAPHNRFESAAASGAILFDSKGVENKLQYILDRQRAGRNIGGLDAKGGRAFSRMPCDLECSTEQPEYLPPCLSRHKLMSVCTRLANLVVAASGEAKQLADNAQEHIAVPIDGSRGLSPSHGGSSSDVAPGGENSTASPSLKAPAPQASTSTHLNPQTDGAAPASPAPLPGGAALSHPLKY
jgi:hypothetical protein